VKGENRCADTTTDKPEETLESDSKLRPGENPALKTKKAD
jgi:hypothetical protein